MARGTSQGAILSYTEDLTGPTPVYTQFAFITTMGTPSASSPEIDGSTLQDTGFRVFFLGLTDPGSVPLTFYIDHEDADQYQAMLGYLQNKQELKWKIDAPISNPSNTTQAADRFNARVQELQKTYELDQMIVGTITLRATGDVAFTPESA